MKNENCSEATQKAQKASRSKSQQVKTEPLASAMNDRQRGESGQRAEIVAGRGVLESRLQGIANIRNSFTDFTTAAFATRDVIGIFLNECVDEIKKIGFHVPPSDESEHREVITDTLSSSLRAMKMLLESELASAEPEEVKLEAYGHIHQRLEQAICIMEEASYDQGCIADDYIEPLAFELLELRAVLATGALEVASRLLSSRVQAELAVHPLASEKGTLILSIQEDSLFTRMFERQEELRGCVLPAVQKTASSMVQHLLSFIDMLSEHPSDPIGFGRRAKRESPPIQANAMLESLRDTSYQLDEHFSALSSETPMDVNFRAYIHNMGYCLGMFQIALKRRVRDGCIPDGDVLAVKAQAQLTFRDLATAVKQLSQVATTDLLEGRVEVRAQSSRDVA